MYGISLRVKNQDKAACESHLRDIISSIPKNNDVQYKYFGNDKSDTIVILGFADEDHASFEKFKDAVKGGSYSGIAIEDSYGSENGHYNGNFDEVFCTPALRM